MIRSYLFYAAFYVLTGFMSVISVPLWFGPRKWAIAYLKLHGRVVLWTCKWVGGFGLEVRGLEHIPNEPYLLVSKHQSSWETFSLPPFMRDPAMMMKVELMSIPFYGNLARKFEMIPVERDRGATALRAILKASKERAAQGREILIFPEGTRRPVHSSPEYQSGILMIYDQLGVPCVPVALNSGVFWPRDTWRTNKGTIIMEFLPPIPSGVPRKEFQKNLINTIENKTHELVEEAFVANPDLRAQFPKGDA